MLSSFHPLWLFLQSICVDYAPIHIFWAHITFPLTFPFVVKVRQSRISDPGSLQLALVNVCPAIILVF
jgi:hypothetical protein